MHGLINLLYYKFSEITTASFSNSSLLTETSNILWQKFEAIYLKVDQETFFQHVYIVIIKAVDLDIIEDKVQVINM